jgi:hypothetical protein
VIRSVDVLIWALIWINVVGLGPFAGALAIACSDTGSTAGTRPNRTRCSREPPDAVTPSDALRSAVSIHPLGHHHRHRRGGRHRPVPDRADPGAGDAAGRLPGCISSTRISSVRYWPMPPAPTMPMMVAERVFDSKASEGVTASGGSRLHRVRFGLVPAVLPVLASQVL